MGRRRAREIALKVLFQVDLVNAEPFTVLEYLLAEYPLSDEMAAFSRILIRGTLEHQAEIDNYIKRYSVEWNLSRMAGVDRNVLRMGIFEILYHKTPVNVAINEAIELARTYSHEDAPRFINGILGRIAREIAEEPGDNS
ncbi:MAG: transcription antitermination factor NusB [Thermacetogeniaceae bacterium]|nr:transcription antitermination factor NusB [Syntrophomonadaceae bacterium]